MVLHPQAGAPDVQQPPSCQSPVLTVEQRSYHTEEENVGGEHGPNPGKEGHAWVGTDGRHSM